MDKPYHLNPKTYTLNSDLGASLKDLGKKVFGFSQMSVETFELLEKLK